MGDHLACNGAVCDHIIAHKGDEVLFYNRDNLQTLCKSCHDNGKQKEDIHGYSMEIGTDGWPVDQKHPFNKAK
jgi:5-methylcytosine-specific restriction enzyme A